MKPRSLILPRGSLKVLWDLVLRSDLPRREGVLGKGSTEGKEAKMGQNYVPSPYFHEVLWVWNLEENSELILWAFGTPEKSWGICAEVAIYGFCWFLIPLASWGSHSGSRPRCQAHICQQSSHFLFLSQGWVAVPTACLGLKPGFLL